MLNRLDPLSSRELVYTFTFIGDGVHPELQLHLSIGNLRASRLPQLIRARYAVMGR